jgi:thiol:disulfide interchange protein
MKTCLLCAFFLLVTWQYLYAQPKINFANFEPDSIIQEAKKQNKPIFLYATLKGCMPCKVLEFHTFSDTTLANFVHQNTIPAKLYVTDKFGKQEYEKRLKISKGINVNAYPTMLVLDSEGKEIDRILGVNTADSVLSILKKYCKSKL